MPAAGAQPPSASCAAARSALRAYAHDVYTYPLPPGHRFPLAKYRLVREAVQRLDGVDVHDARRATWRELRAAHTTAYLARVRSGALTRREELALGRDAHPSAEAEGFPQAQPEELDRVPQAGRGGDGRRDHAQPG